MKLRIALSAGAIGASCLAAPTALHGGAGAIVPEGVHATAHLMALHQVTTTITKVEAPIEEAPIQKLAPVHDPAKCVENKVLADSINTGDLIYIEGEPSYVTDISTEDGFITINGKSAVEGKTYSIKENEDSMFDVPKQFSGEYYVHIVKAPAGTSVENDTVELISKVDGSNKVVVPEGNVNSKAWDDMMYPTIDDGEHKHKAGNMPLMSVTYLCGKPNEGIHILEVKAKYYGTPSISDIISDIPKNSTNYGKWTDESDSYWDDAGEYDSQRLHTDEVQGPRMSKPSP